MAVYIYSFFGIENWNRFVSNSKISEENERNLDTNWNVDFKVGYGFNRK